MDRWKSFDTLRVELLWIAAGAAAQLALAVGVLVLFYGHSLIPNLDGAEIAIAVFRRRWLAWASTCAMLAGGPAFLLPRSLLAVKLLSFYMAVCLFAGAVSIFKNTFEIMSEHFCRLKIAVNTFHWCDAVPAAALSFLCLAFALAALRQGGRLTARLPSQ